MVKMAIGNYIESKRPPVKVRHLADLAYKIEGADVIIYDIRDQKTERNIAKVTFVPDDKSWNVFRMKTNQWHRYEKCESVANITDFVNLLKKDEAGYFWG